MRQRVVLATLHGGIAYVFACAALAAPSKAEGASAPEAVSPALAARGFVALSLGTAVVDGKTRAEGPASGGATFALSYQKALAPYLGLRAFGHRSGWSTQLSDVSGDGDRVAYDLGAAPALTWPVSSGRGGISLLLLVPISFSLSHAPARAPRQVVREEMDLGTGYRIGVGAGMLTRLGRSFAMLVEAEYSKQRISHERAYRWADGRDGVATQNIDYRLSWVRMTVGLVFMP